MSIFKKKFKGTKTRTILLKPNLADESKPNININRKISKHIPSRYSEAKIVADSLLSRKNIILDVSLLSEKDKIKFVNFLSGIIYALNGKVFLKADKMYHFSIEQ